MINTKFTYAEGSGDFPTDNDYRRIGLVINPYKNGTQELTSDLTLSATKAVIFSPTFTGNFKLMRLSHNLMPLVVSKLLLVDVLFLGITQRGSLSITKTELTGYSLKLQVT